jgi:hypothetical protein
MPAQTSIPYTEVWQFEIGVKRKLIIHQDAIFKNVEPSEGCDIKFYFAV